jgi:hypothetical protein
MSCVVDTASQTLTVFRGCALRAIANILRIDPDDTATPA